MGRHLQQTQPPGMSFDFLEMLKVAESLGLANQWEEAARTARLICEKDRTHVGALEILARANWQLGRFADVADHTRLLVRLDPYNPGYRTLLGSALQCMGNYAGAMHAYSGCARLGPSSEAQRCDQLINDLRQWQSELISDLLSRDPAFRAEFSRDRAAACSTRGFEMLESRQVAEPCLTDERPVVRRWARPS